jgi:hypothetical protein
MDDITIKIEARVVGQRAQLHSPWQLALPTSLTEKNQKIPNCLRDLLEYIVREEVRAFRLRQETRRLERVLGPRVIAAAASEGKVVMGGPGDRSQEHREPEAVDERVAVATALQAFKDGLYFVFLNGIQQHHLDAAVALRPANTLTFIRLVALVGG